jgi:hypothetical protein
VLLSWLTSVSAISSGVCSSSFSSFFIDVVLLRLYFSGSPISPTFRVGSYLSVCPHYSPGWNSLFLFGGFC